MDKKVCTKCEIEKELIYFGMKKDQKDGLRSVCKACDKIYQTEYRKNNKEKYYNKEYYEANKEYFKQQAMLWRLNNLEHSKEYQKEYYLENKEHLDNVNKQYHKDNKERLKEYRKAYYKEYWKKHYRSKGKTIKKEFKDTGRGEKIEGKIE